MDEYVNSVEIVPNVTLTFQPRNVSASPFGTQAAQIPARLNQVHFRRLLTTSQCTSANGISARGRLVRFDSGTNPFGRLSAHPAQRTSWHGCLCAPQLSVVKGFMRLHSPPCCPGDKCDAWLAQATALRRKVMFGNNYPELLERLVRKQDILEWRYRPSGGTICKHARATDDGSRFPDSLPRCAGAAPNDHPIQRLALCWGMDQLSRTSEVTLDFKAMRLA